MKTCPVCKNKVPIGKTVCPTCGRQLRAKLQAQICEQTASRAREVFGSRLGLAFCILLSVSCGLQLLSVLWAHLHASETGLFRLWKTLAESVFEGGSHTAFPFVFALSLTVLGRAEQLLTTVGAWLVYRAAINRERPMKTGGLTLHQVSNACVAVFYGLLFLLLGVLGGLLLSSHDGRELSELYLLVLMLPPALIGGLLLYYAKCFQQLSYMKRTLQNGEQTKTSVFLIVCCFLLALWEGVLLRKGASDPFATAGTLLNMALSACAGVFLLVYREKTASEGGK